MRRTPILAIVLTSCAVALAACGSSSKSSTPTSAAETTTTAAASVTTAPADAAAGPAIVIGTGGGGSGFMFSTSPVKAGATVSIKNTTAAQHTVSADTTEGGFDVSVDPGQTTTFTAPSTPGAYKFHCNIHTDMMGTLTVT